MTTRAIFDNCFCGGPSGLHCAEFFSRQNYTSQYYGICGACAFVAFGHHYEEHASSLRCALVAYHAHGLLLLLWGYLLMQSAIDKRLGMCSAVSN